LINDWLILGMGDFTESLGQRRSGLAVGSGEISTVRETWTSRNCRHWFSIWFSKKDNKHSKTKLNRPLSTGRTTVLW